MEIAHAVSPHVDWLEAGTSLIKLTGTSAIRALRAEFPDHVVVADMKTADGGRKETEMAWNAGADVSTVLGLVPDKSVSECLAAARDAGRTIFVDLMGCPPERWARLHDLGATHVIYHIGTDEQAEKSLKLETVLRLKRAYGFTVAVAGGLTPERLASIKTGGPDVAIIGSAITGAPDPAAAARAFREVTGG